MASAGDIITIVEKAGKAVQYFQGIRSAPKERNALLEQVDGLQSLFKGLKDINFLITMDLSKEDQDRLCGFINKLDPQLQHLHQDLRQKPKRFDEFWTRLRWPGKKAEVQQSLTDLKSAVDTIQRYQDMANAKREAWNRIREWIRPDIAEQVRTTPYINEITKGTGEGLLRSKQFEEWRATENGVLWFNGHQGSGKTGQITVIQKHLEHQANKLGHQVAVVYCNEQALRSLNDPMDIIMSFWAQLDAIGGTSELKLAKETLDKIRSALKTDGQPTLSKDEATKLKMDIICHHIENSPPTILILDGLDEVPLDSLSSLSQDIVGRLRDVQKRTKNCHLLFASRQYDSIRRIFSDISHQFEDSTFFNCQSEVGKLELKRYVEEQIDKHNWTFKQSENGATVKRVINALVPKCIGEESFLLARLYMHEVLKAGTLLELDSILKHLPTSVNEAYDLGLQRLTKECAECPNGLPCKAIQVLYWTTWAKRPLRSEELEQILAIDEGESNIDVRSLGKASFGSGIEAFCGQLVVVDSMSGEVSVEHRTLTEHLAHPGTLKKWWRDRSLPEYMSSILMTYLSLKCMRETGVDTDQSEADTDQSKAQLPLLSYALQYWGDFLTDLPDLKDDARIWEQVFHFLTGPSQEWNEYVNKKARAVVAKKHPETTANGNDALSTGTLSPIHWAVDFNLVSLIPRLFDHQMQSPPEKPVPISPLGLAVSHRTEVTSCLLECGASANDYDPINRPRRPPLYDAIAYGLPDCVRVLLEAGAQWTVKREDSNKSALHLLFYYLDRIDLAELAVETMSHEELASSEGLQLLVKGRFTEKLRRAIDNDLDVNRPCDNGKRALDYAYELADAEIIKLLKLHGATPRLRWPAFQPGSSSIPQNFPKVQHTGPAIIKEATSVEFQGATYSGRHDPWETVEVQVLLDVLIDADFKLPVRSLVLETISCDQGWSSHEGENTYLGSGHGCSFFVRIRNQEKLSIFDLQHNVHASGKSRLHTNVWNLSDLDISFPAMAHCMRAMQSGTSLQVVSRTRGKGWRNKVEFARVRVYGEEVDL